MLDVGSMAPEFAAPDQDGKERKLADYRGRWLLLYFYPKDDTPGCTAEACALRDSWSDFEKTGAAVLGVSKDSVKSHGKFAAKYGLPFTIISDEDRAIIRAYGADGLIRRVSYLIDPEGKIAKAYPKVKPAGHAAEVLADLAELRKLGQGTAVDGATNPR